MPSLAPLDDDEVLLWQGAPDPRAHLTRSDFFIIPFSVIWVVISVTTFAAAIRPGTPAVAVVITSLLVLIGAYLVFGRFLVKAAVKRATVYRLTTRRALIDTPRSSDSMALSPDLITMRRNPWNSRVDVHFGTEVDPWSRGARRSSRAAYANTGLEYAINFSPAPFAFYDIGDREGLTEALSHAGVVLVDRGDEAT